MNEYLETMADDDMHRPRLHRPFERLVTATTFDPSRPNFTIFSGTGPANTKNSLWREARAPMMLMEQRIGPCRTPGRFATTEERLEFGRQLARAIAEVVQ